MLAELDHGGFENSLAGALWITLALGTARRSARLTHNHTLTESYIYLN
jgi:hypothetical protein